MELSALVTKVNALGGLFRGLTLAIGIVPASLVGTALAVNVNQHGLTGTGSPKRHLSCGTRMTRTVHCRAWKDYAGTPRKEISFPVRLLCP